MARVGWKPPAGPLGVYLEQAMALKGQATHLVHSAHQPMAADYYRSAAQLLREAAEMCEKAAREAGQ